MTGSDRADGRRIEDGPLPGGRRYRRSATGLTGLAVLAFGAIAYEAGDVGEVVGIAAAAEHDLHDGRVPYALGLFTAPAVPSLGEGLEGGQGGDPGPTPFGHECPEAGKRVVGRLVQDEPERWVQTPLRVSRQPGGGPLPPRLRPGRPPIRRWRSPPTPYRSGTGCPFLRKKVAGSKCSPGPGETASSTWGSARAAKALATMAQIESRWRWSAETMASSALSHAKAAPGAWTRMSTASLAAAGESDQR